MKRSWVFLAGVAIPFSPSWGQEAPTINLPEIEVIATTPVGTGVDPNKVPVASSVVTSSDVARTGEPSVLRALEERVGGIIIDNAQNNPFQPNVIYRGFEASPLGGNPQGLAVYLNGTRFNQAFGDTVNWDLIPDVAVDSITVEGSNPAFGLNALGGSIAVQLKNGFTYHGTEVRGAAGSFGRISSSLQHGQEIGNVGIYVAVSGLNDDGWRVHSPSRLRQIYADLGLKADKGEFHLSVVGADNHLTGNGTVPVELWHAAQGQVFTYPDVTDNQYGRVIGSGTYEFTPAFSLQGNIYYGQLRQRTMNGDAAEVEACEDDDALLCGEDGGPLTTPGGGFIPNFLTTSVFSGLPQFAGRFDEGGPYAALNRSSTNSENYGGTLQGTYKSDLVGMPNRLVLGASFDGGVTDFRASSEVGALTLDRGFAGPSFIFSTDDNSVSPVSVRARNAYTGLYISDMLDITDRLTLSIGGRFNYADIELRDQFGTALNGDHTFSRFNPGGGLTYKITPDISVYGGYAEANRAPTPAELSCADPEAPCSLTNFFVGDPPLEQVVSRTYEAGFRGRVPNGLGLAVDWKIGAFRATNSDDILFVSSPTPGRAFFQNVGETRRQGVEAGLSVKAAVWNAFVEYAYTDATFQSPLTLNSPENPFATPDPADDENGLIFVTPGDKLPGIPAHSLKVGFNWNVTPEWQVGLTARMASGKYLVGDEFEPQPESCPVRRPELQHKLPDHEEHPDLRNRGKPAEHKIRDVRDVLACDRRADPASAERDRDPQRQSGSAIRRLCRASDFVLARSTAPRISQCAETWDPPPTSRAVQECGPLFPPCRNGPRRPSLSSRSLSRLRRGTRTLIDLAHELSSASAWRSVRMRWLWLFVAALVAIAALFVAYTQFAPGRGPAIATSDQNCGSAAVAATSDTSIPPGAGGAPAAISTTPTIRVVGPVATAAEVGSADGSVVLSVTPTLTGQAVGDRILLFVGARTKPATPSGMTLIGDSSGQTNHGVVAAYQMVATSAAEICKTVSIRDARWGNHLFAVLIAVRNSPGGVEAVGAAATNAPDSADLAGFAVATSGNDRLVFNAWGWRDNYPDINRGANPGSPAAGWEEAVESTATTGYSDGFAVDYKLRTSTGTEAAPTRAVARRPSGDKNVVGFAVY